MASKRAQRRRACERKRRFPTFEAACATASYWARRTGEHIQAYRCHFCRGWHTGHWRAGQWMPHA